MAKIDLTSREWCDLVFEGRNKAYGAFELRQSSPKRHNIAMIIIIVVAVIAFSVPALIRFVTPEKVEAARQLNEIARRRGQTLAEMALAWVLKDERMTSVIVGASSVKQLADNLKTLEHLEFAEEELQEIERIL